MNEEAQAAPSYDALPTAGRLLREAREAAGLHVATLAVALKVPVRKLEALEEDRYDQLPDAVFVRALASSVCRTLKIDAQPVLARLPQTETPRLMDRADGINTPFRAPGEGPAQKWNGQVSKPAVFIVIALLIGAVVLVFLPSHQEEPVAAATSKPAAPAPAVAPAPASPGVPGQPTADGAALQAPAGSAGGVAAAAAPPVAGAPAAPASSTAAPGVAAAAAPAASSRTTPGLSTTIAGLPSLPASAASAAAANGVVNFRTSGESWVKVTDARGTTVFQKLMTAGETAGASGTLPLSVTVGSVRATQVDVRGQPYDLAPVARDNVARFEVK